MRRIHNRRGGCERPSFCPHWDSNEEPRSQVPVRYPLSHGFTRVIVTCITRLSCWIRSNSNNECVLMFACQSKVFMRSICFQTNVVKEKITLCILHMLIAGQLSGYSCLVGNYKKLGNWIQFLVMKAYIVTVSSQHENKDNASFEH